LKGNKTNMKRIFCSAKQKLSKMLVHGIDIETYDKNMKILMTSIYNDNGYNQVFIRQNKFLYAMKHGTCFRGCILSATNLSFDFFGMFNNHRKEKGQFMTLFRGSSLIFAKTRVVDKEFHYNVKSRYVKILKFLDTMNFCPISVKNAGELLALPKLDMKENIGIKPKTADEWHSMISYNVRDSEISGKFMKFLRESFEFFGATFKDTVASTAMSLFKNKYLGKRRYFRHDEELLIEIFKSYYGGRCEVLKRGITGKMYYYDLNSLYPSVMHDNVFPDPNSVHFTYENNTDKILLYEGCSDVSLVCPRMRYPLLPVRYEDKTGKKVLFPVGKFKGWYTHVELRKALELGYTITEVRKSIYYTKTCQPFKEYVDDLYNARLKFQKEKNPMEMVCKLLMNSLYGKYGEKFLDRENTIPCDLVDEKFLKENDILEIIGDYARYKQGYSNPAPHCIPIWASYVTAYGRLKLYDAIVKYGSVYHDTDAILTDKIVPTSDRLGEFKLEMEISQAVLVKPKFYALYGIKKGENVEEVKIKGFSRAITQLKIAGQMINLDGRRKKNMNFMEFKRFLANPKAEYDKFVKFKEALRRQLIPNQVIFMEKWFNIEDDKRIWNTKFELGELQDSNPVMLTIT
jgi:hypothetical protein